MSLNRFNPNVLLFRDTNFPQQNIKDFVAKQLGISENDVLETLYRALPEDKQNEANQAIIEASLKKSVNASGAIMLFINTKDGLQLLAGVTERRKRVVASNGACEKGESMAETAVREFSEELANPSKDGVLANIVKDNNNCHSLAITNQIGESAKMIATRIVENKFLYFNMSAIYVNTTPVNEAALQAEIMEMNTKLASSKQYYDASAAILFGTPKKDLNLPEVKEEAAEIINGFIKNCSANITDNFSSVLSKSYSADTDAKELREALLAIADLAENYSLVLISQNELESLLALNLNDPAVEAEFKKTYFKPSFENILKHKGNISTTEFVNNLTKRTSIASQMDLGMLSSQNRNSESTSSSEKININNSKRS